MRKKLLVLICTIAAALLVATVALGRVAELGTTLGDHTAACPDNCQAIGQVSGFQIQQGSRRNPYRLRSYGKVVAFSVKLGKPNVHGGVDRFRGQATVFSLPEGPCYRCLFDEPPPPGTALNCAEAGVLGVVPGIIGLIQAAEALELILGIGEPLIGRLLTLDALPMTFREIPIRKDPHCPMCGPNGPSNLDEIEYSEFSCAISVAVHER